MALWWIQSSTQLERNLGLMALTSDVFSAVSAHVEKRSYGVDSLLGLRKQWARLMSQCRVCLVLRDRMVLGQSRSGSGTSQELNVTIEAVGSQRINIFRILAMDTLRFADRADLVTG